MPPRMRGGRRPTADFEADKRTESDAHAVADCGGCASRLSSSTKMSKHYIYRLDHDLGFAPNAGYGICTLCGCKTHSIEAWAKPGSWVIGIGGIGTGQRDRLIYAMQVEQVMSYAEFEARYPQKSSYLEGRSIDPAANVLFSRRFYYFGDKAFDLPEELQHIIIHGRGCKLVSDEDAATLEKYLAKQYKYGKHGKPNNVRPQAEPRC